jgi:hypothetical protein
MILTKERHDTRYLICFRCSAHSYASKKMNTVIFLPSQLWVGLNITFIQYISQILALSCNHLFIHYSVLTFTVFFKLFNIEPFSEIKSHSISIIFLTSSLFTQTLTTLYLSWNQIGPQGAEHLGHALQINKVIPHSFSSLHHSRTFHTDTHHTKPLFQSNRWSRSRTSWQCSTNQQSNTTLLLITSSFTHFSHRHSPRYTSFRIKLLIKEQNILAMLYKSTK